jgi:hypothetical protein
MTYLAKSEISKLLDTLTGDDRRVALLPQHWRTLG